jgi:hypothetical protein
MSLGFASTSGSRAIERLVYPRHVVLWRAGVGHDDKITVSQFLRLEQVGISYHKQLVLSVRRLSQIVALLLYCAI